MKRSSASPNVIVRPLEADDEPAWKRLWASYNAFYGRSGPTALPEEVTERTLQRCLDERVDLHAVVALLDGKVCGLAHYLFHRATTSIEPNCYLSDIYTEERFRGRGVASALIEEVCRRASLHGAAKVYWQTQASNIAARRLYDRVAENSGFIVYRKLL